ncbi:MAG: SDR family NAD(P)-dependent oxidoreductase [Acidobacteriota bacterium]
MKRYLITGASRGIGRAIAVRLAAPGRELLVHGRDLASLEETCGAVRTRGGRAVPLRADLRRPEEIHQLAQVVGQAGLDVLVNNAGYAVVKPLAEIGLSEWQDGLAIMATAPFLLIQSLLPVLGRGATIVNLQSVASRRGFPGWSAYCAAKFALEGLSLSLREELRPRGVRVVNVYPAATDTTLWSGIAGSWPRERMLTPEEVAEAITYALDRPPGVLVESIELGDLSGPL